MLLHSGIDVMTQMPVASELLHRLVPSFSLSMIRVDAACAPQEHYSEYFDDFSHRLFAESGHLFAAQKDDPAAFGNLLRGRKPYGNLIDGAPEFLSGATYEHLFSRNGIHHVLDVAVRDASGPLAILGIFREMNAKAFTRSEVFAVSEFYDALVHAFRAEPVPASFDETDSAMILTNADGVIEWATPNARVWLEDASGGLERARLMDKNVLPEACRSLAQRLRGGESPTLCLPIAGGRLRLRAYGMTPFSSNDLSTRIAIQLRLEMHRSLKVYLALEKSALTPQQRRIALAHFEGRSTREISEALGITPSTLKSYHKDLYARLGVRSSAELVRALEAMADGVTFDLERHLPRTSNTKVPNTP